MQKSKNKTNSGHFKDFWKINLNCRQLKAQQLLEDPMAPDGASLDMSQGSLSEDDHDD